MSGGGAFKVFIALHMVDYASSHLNHFNNLLMQSGNNVDLLNSRLKLMGSLAAVMIGGATVGVMTNFAKESLAAAGSIEQLKNQMSNMGMTAKDIATITKDVQGLSQIHPALNMKDQLSMAKEAYAVFGKTEEVRKALPTLDKAQLALAGLYGKEKAPEYMWDIMRSAELQMGGQFTADKFSKYLESYILVNQITAGHADPKKIHQTLMNMPMTRQVQTPEALAKEAVMIMEMGSRAGTSFAAMDRFMVGHINRAVSKEKMAKWEEYGLLEDVQKTDKGKITGFKVKGEELWLKDKVEWIEKVMAPAMQSRGIDPYDPKNVSKIAEMWSAQGASGAVISTVLQKAGVIRHTKMAGEAGGIEGGAKAFETSYEGKKAAWESSWLDFKLAMGEAFLPEATKFLGVATKILRVINMAVIDHPKIATGTFVGAGVGALGLTGLGIGGIVGSLLPGLKTLFILLGGARILGIVSALGGLISLPAWGTVLLVVGSLAGLFLVIQKSGGIIASLKSIWNWMLNTSPTLRILVEKFKEMAQQIKSHGKLWTDLNNSMVLVKAAIEGVVQAIQWLIQQLGNLASFAYQFSVMGQLDKSIAGIANKDWKLGNNKSGNRVGRHHKVSFISASN